jgi:hypothetical protein
MLLRAGKGEAWPQRKVHGDRNGSYGDSEWPAVLAAHRQLSSPVDLDTLDDVLAERYRRDTELRVKARDTMISRIRAGLPGATTNSTKYEAILRIVELQSQQAIHDPDDDDRHLTLLARAITANIDSADASDAEISSAFIALVNAAGDQDNAEDQQFDDEAASFAWQSLEEHLGEGYLCDAGYSEEVQSTSLSARYTTGADHYFDWQDADNDDARTLADKFLARFSRLAGQGEGWSYAYAGWYQRLLGLADRGWMPVVLSDDSTSSYKKINLHDLRPEDWRTGNEKKPSLPLPPAGKLQRDFPNL